MSPAASRPEEALGVECAWPIREAVAPERSGRQHGASDSRRHAWRAIALVVVAVLLGFGGWSLKDAAIDFVTVVPSTVPTQTE